MKRLFSFFLIVVLLLNTFLPMQVKAQSITGPWTWTDISSQITHRTNRPLWAIGYASGSWFYTDGLIPIGSLGQVYRYDGFIQTNITEDIVTAGLTRVDDIVTDGQTVLFLQGVVSWSNYLLGIVAYQNGHYVNVTEAVKSVLASNEGVSQIVGRHGNWRIITTKGRLLGWDGSSSPAFEIPLPAVITDVWNRYQSLDSYKQRMLYNAADSYTLAPLKIQPMNDSEWVIQVVDELAISQNAYGSTWQDPLTRFYRITQNNIVGITPILEVGGGDMLASNGIDILMVEHGSIRPYFYMSTLSSTGQKGLHSEPIVNFYPEDIQMRVAWNGKSWMVLSLEGGSNYPKAAYRFDPNSPVNALLEARFPIRDYLFALASDQNGRTLLGGAVSNMGMTGYLLPLTAKLVMVTEDVSTSRP